MFFRFVGRLFFGILRLGRLGVFKIGCACCCLVMVYVFVEMVFVFLWWLFFFFFGW